MRHAVRAVFALAGISLGSCAGDPTKALVPDAALLAAGGNRDEIRVNMLDNCDPETFNAAIGPGTCVRNGGLTVQHFFDQLGRSGIAPSWRFTPGQFLGFVGQTVQASNLGGEAHTFTPVAAFGGGIVPPLNALTGNPVPAPECLTLQPADFVAPGDTYGVDLDQAGVQRFQCCIHPWMRSTAVVR
jgi:hypothetical protein